MRRLAGPGDRELVRTLHHAAYRDVVERQFGHWDESEQDVWFGRVWDRHHHELLAVAGATCGYAVVDVAADAVHVRELVVHPDHQGRGIGTVVLQAAVDEARRLAVPARLQVLQANVGARRLYERVGFQVVGATETHLQMAIEP